MDFEFRTFHPLRLLLPSFLRRFEAVLDAGVTNLKGQLETQATSAITYGLEPLFAALAERHPALRLHIRQDSAAPLIADVRDGRLDVAVTFSARVPDDLEHERLKDEAAILAVPAGYPAAGRRTVALGELHDETFVLDVPGDNPDYDDAVIDACRRSGFEPRTRASSAIHDAWATCG